MRRRAGLWTVAILLAAGLVLPRAWALSGTASQGSPAPPAMTDQQRELLAHVREKLQRERNLLLEYVYREKRRPLKVSPFGKVSLGDEMTFEVTPSADPDRPFRTLLEVNGRPATAEERRAFARRQEHDLPKTPSQQRERERKDAETRRKAQERFEDAFRVFRFEAGSVQMIDGRPTRVVAVLPRPGAETRSDVGRWMKKFRGTAWVDETEYELLKLEMVATDNISLGWGVVGRIAAGTKVTYTRRPVESGAWLPARARFEARGRTLLLRSFEVDSTTEWFDYRPYVPRTADTATPRQP